VRYVGRGNAKIAKNEGPGKYPKKGGGQDFSLNAAGKSKITKRGQKIKGPPAAIPCNLKCNKFVRVRRSQQ